MSVFGLEIIDGSGVKWTDKEFVPCFVFEETITSTKTYNLVDYGLRKNISWVCCSPLNSPLIFSTSGEPNNLSNITWNGDKFTVEVGNGDRFSVIIGKING